MQTATAGVPTRSRVAKAKCSTRQHQLEKKHFLVNKNQKITTECWRKAKLWHVTKFLANGAVGTPLKYKVVQI
jgi:hypothetical protein